MFNIWADGSYRSESRILGAGWVIRRGKELEAERSLTLPRLISDHNRGSSIAELLAFTHALREVPAQSQVHVRMDCADVIGWLSQGKVTGKATGSSELVKAFQQALQEKNRMTSVAITLITGKHNVDLGQAHKLSRIASTPGRAKHFD